MWAHKATHIITGAVAKEINSELKEELLLNHWYGLATDGSSDEDDQFLPVLVRYVDKDSGLTVTSLLEMPNVNSGSTAQQMYDVCNEAREVFSLHWDNFVAYSYDNTNSLTGTVFFRKYEVHKVTKRFLTLVALVI